MKRPSLLFLDDFEIPGKVKVLLENETVTVACSISGGFPSPLLTASIVNSKEEIIRELPEALEEPASLSDSDGTYNLTKVFALKMIPKDVGEFVQCHSDQGAIGFEVKEKRELAVKCGCSEAGSRDSTNCNSKTGQCECYPNFSERNCDVCANYFLGYPQCNGIDSKFTQVK